LRIRGQQRALEGSARGKQRDPQRVGDVERGRYRQHRRPRQHGGTHRSHTTTTPDETRIDNFQARSNTARFGNDGNLINNQNNRGLATVSDAGSAPHESPVNKRPIVPITGA
jgi:hypothetical protein